MSEVKFACPICGQHITCDAAKSGSHMPCPTCYRELVVPQAPSATGSKLILAASEVQSRPVPTGLSAPPPPRNAATRSLLPNLLGAVALLAILLTIGFFYKNHLSQSAEPGNPIASESAPKDPKEGANSGSQAGAGAEDGWTQNLADVQIPDARAKGRVHGFKFAVEKATLTGGILNLRQGQKWPPDLGMTLYLFAERGEDLAGKTIIIEPNRTSAPKLTLRWKDAASQPATETMKTGYALRLEFEAVAGKAIPGKIYLAINDAERSFVAGSFTAEIRKPAPPKK